MHRKAGQGEYFSLSTSHREDSEVHLLARHLKKDPGRGAPLREDVEVFLFAATSKHCLLPLAGRGGEESLGVSSQILDALGEQLSLESHCHISKLYSKHWWR